VNAWAPLRHRAFRALWLASFTALTGSWIADSTAAWLMTSLSTSPLQVALVSSAITLPILMMALPAGAAADLFDRRLVLMVTQVWVTVVLLVLFAVSFTGKLTAELLLVLTFVHGIGNAIRFPVTAAMTPGLVPRTDLPNALALHGVSFNGARVVGPVLAGLLLTWIAGAWVFLICALISMIVTVAYARGAAQQRTSSLPNERFVAAMRLGLQFSRQTPAMVAALAHVRGGDAGLAAAGRPRPAGRRCRHLHAAALGHGHRRDRGRACAARAAAPPEPRPAARRFCNHAGGRHRRTVAGDQRMDRGAGGVRRRPRLDGDVQCAKRDRADIAA